MAHGLGEVVGGTSVALFRQVVGECLEVEDGGIMGDRENKRFYGGSHVTGYINILSHPHH